MSHLLCTMPCTNIYDHRGSIDMPRVDAGFRNCVFLSWVWFCFASSMYFTFQLTFSLVLHQDNNSGSLVCCITRSIIAGFFFFSVVVMLFFCLFTTTFFRIFFNYREERGNIWLFPYPDNLCWQFKKKSNTCLNHFVTTQKVNIVVSLPARHSLALSSTFRFLFISSRKIFCLSPHVFLLIYSF